MISKLIFYFGLWASKKRLQEEFGKSFYKDFVNYSKDSFTFILPLTPKISDSIFKFNFAFAPCYIAWYKAFSLLKQSKDTTIHWIWNINEDLILLLPHFILKQFGAKIYLGGFRKKAKAHEALSIQNKLHEHDFKIKYRPVDDNTFEIEIYQCGMKKLCEEHGAADLLPGICRIDYLIAHYMGCGFYRTKTLGDGDDVCNCRYSMNGNCSWPLEKGSTIVLK